VVDDLRGLYERLSEAGVDSWFSGPIEVDTGANRGSLALYLRDPDGIVLELFQPPA
jgi:catechol-2,3-dioxygenase